LRVRSGYINHIRNLNIIATHFVPSILGLLELYDGVKKAFKLDFWAVDEYYLDCKYYPGIIGHALMTLHLVYESGTSISLQLLASHVFYRALMTVPSLIRAWLLDCTDRQLSSSVISYTSQYFSPVIIRTELAHVKSPETVAELTDENMTVKVAQAVNEVTASYLVDEHQLEITLKMPMDWPLHTIEIKDAKKVGVLEDRWRAWVFGIQQIIWSQVRNAKTWLQATCYSCTSPRMGASLMG
jgi:E3 ubiquitin-protein ligase listerin